MGSSSTSSNSNQKSFKYHVFLSFRGEDTRKTFVDHLYASLKQRESLPRTSRKHLMASSSSSSNQKSFKYHVFLSFRGEDTRKTFVDHLYTSLTRVGIHTFRDNEELEKGKQIDQLFEAIEESRFFIIVFSKNYASSSWCLKEVTKIMECQDGNQQIAYPVFYDVEPTDIRRQSGPVGIAIAKHKSNEQIRKWEKALKDAGNLVGWDLKNVANGHEAESIKKIVEKVSLKLRSIHLSNDENVIGMDRRMRELELSLGIGLNDKARMIGIKGMGGIGKTTLARAIFDKVSSHFEGSVFVEDVREVSEKESLRSLQERVLSGILNDEHMQVGSVFEGTRIMRMRLPYKKIILVLDDVDDAKQLEALAGDWFKEGSRIIITTRDEKVLLAHGIDKNWIHDASLLLDEEAMSLFSRYAFKSHIPDEGYEELSSKVVRYAAGLPLTIKVLGSHLRGEDKFVWRDLLKRLKTIPSRETLKVLEISYNNLEDDHKEMFLDVACFLKGSLAYQAIRILDCCGFHATYGLRILKQKSLITISNNKLRMHDRIVELGKNIVRGLQPHEPNKHSRLWIYKEIEELFSDDVGTKASACTGMMFELKEPSPDIIIKNLGNLNKLRFLLLIKYKDDCFPGRKFDQAKQYFPNSLQYLLCPCFPFQSLPQTFRANNLVGLELPYSKIVQLWESGERRVLKKLRFLNLRHSKLRTLDLGMTPNLERLELRYCHDLTEIHAPAGCLDRLVFVDLYGCSWFVSFPLSKQLESLVLLSIPKLCVFVRCLEGFPRDSSNNLPMLQFTFHYYNEQPSSSISSESKGVFLDLHPRTKLESVSQSICGLQHLTLLRVEGCIPEVPNDIGQLRCLEQLDLVSTHIKCLPDSICLLKHLKSLKLKDCQHLEELPKNLGWLENLEELSLSPASIRRLPDSIFILKHLKSLELESCRLLEKLPEDIGQLECLEKLILTKCASLGDIPNSICNMKCLRLLVLRFCSRVEKLPEELGNLRLLEDLNLEFTGISHLPHSISSMDGIHTFRDNEELEKGKQIVQLFEAIEESRFFIIVFSKNYASSSWCLKEITKSMECQDGDQQIAYPLFYDVEPSDIRKQSGPVETAIAKYKTNEHIKEWEKALEDAGESGWVGSEKHYEWVQLGIHEAEAIDHIVKEISQKLHSIDLSKDENLINMDRRMRRLESSLMIGLDDKARMIGIKGMGGIGKTTLAKAIFNKFSSHFEGSVFIENVRQVLEKKGLESLQERILSSVLKDEHIRVGSVYDGERIMRMRLSDKKVLLVLDDVDDAKQLEALAGNWFKDGSRIIITTRDEKVMLAHGVNANWIHNVGLLSNEEAMTLFSRYAFTTYVPNEEKETLSSEAVQEVVCYAAGLPLMIKVLGLHLLGEKEIVWRDALKRLETIPSYKTLDVLEISYNSLEDDYKEIFLDVACFLKGVDKDQAIEMLDSCGFRDNLVGLHLPRSRILQLWESGQRKVLKKLRFLRLQHSKLRTLDRRMTPNLERLDLSECRDLTKIYAPGCLQRLVFVNLRGCSWSVSFSLSKQLESCVLRSIPKLSVFMKRLERLPRDCRNNLPMLRFLFQYIPKQTSSEQTSSVGFLSKGVFLDLQPCIKLENVSGSICGLQSLRNLTFDGCIPKVPNDIDQLKCLEHLTLLSTRIKCLPDSVCLLKHLKSLRVKNCQHLEEVPQNLGWLENLEELSLSSTSIRRHPDSICMLIHLKYLQFESCGLLEKLPEDIGHLECLENLNLGRCTSLGDIPDSICNMKCLRSFYLPFCSSVKKLPEEFGSLECLMELDISFTGIKCNTSKFFANFINLKC
ncbi:hypothetical protein LXL04_010639 [Taraxacum kok-saghyz]